MAGIRAGAKKKATTNKTTVLIKPPPTNQGTQSKKLFIKLITKPHINKLLKQNQLRTRTNNILNTFYSLSLLGL
jgi:hypothetical protein